MPQKTETGRARLQAAWRASGRSVSAWLRAEERGALNGAACPAFYSPCRKYFAAQVIAKSGCDCVLVLFGVVVCLQRGAVRRKRIDDRVGNDGPRKTLY